MDTGLNSEKFFYTDYNVSLAGFYETALKCYHKKDYLATAGMLQQIVIFTYRTLIKTMGGDFNKYFCLKQMKEYLLTYLPEFSHVFPADNEQDNALFEQLTKLGTESYLSKLNISEKEILRLLIRIDELQNMAQEVFLKQLK